VRAGVLVGGCTEELEDCEEVAEVEVVDENENADPGRLGTNAAASGLRLDPLDDDDTVASDAADVVRAA
jgi:hypothetical protein